jgi:hypothetical protein
MGFSNLQAVEKPASGMTVDDSLIIQATGVQKTYHTGQVSVPALRGVDLSVRRGEMVAIRLRQDHAAQLPLGSGHRRSWPDRHRGRFPLWDV